MERPTVALKRVFVFWMKPKAAQCVQKRSVDTAVKSEKQANEAAPLLADSLRRVSDVKEEAKIVAGKLTGMGKKATRLVETAEDRLRWIAESSRRTELLEEKAQDLKSRLRKLIKARDAAVSESNNRQQEKRALDARVRLLG